MSVSILNSSRFISNSPFGIFSSHVCASISTQISKLVTTVLMMAGVSANVAAVGGKINCSSSFSSSITSGSVNTGEKITCTFINKAKISASMSIIKCD